jgi:hypothetical protein
MTIDPTKIRINAKVTNFCGVGCDDEEEDEHIGPIDI